MFHGPEIVPCNGIFTPDNIRTQLSNMRTAKTIAGKRRAAVAMILTGNQIERKLLFIRRAEYQGDPWSGDVAFPGGGVEDLDTDSRATAERETFEEIGLELPSESHLGTLGSISGAYLPVSIACHVYLLQELPPLSFNGEVVDSFCIPFKVLLEPERNQRRTFEYRNSLHSHPTIELEGYCDHFLWGISYRILQKFLTCLNITTLA